LGIGKASDAIAAEAAYADPRQNEEEEDELPRAPLAEASSIYRSTR
jgi:hypothetical protein